MSRYQRLAGTGAVLLLATLGLTACSEDAEEPTTSTESPASEETEEAAPAAEGQPEWANPIADGGEVVATIELGDVVVEARQMDTAEATRTGNFVDPENNEPLVAEGDEIVFMNYVVTNNGDPIDLGSSLVSVDARYEDWPYMQGMDGITDLELFESMGVYTSGVAVGENTDPPIYTLGTGESFAVGENFKYEPGSPITFKVTMTPVDSEGDLLHDDRMEGEGAGTIS